MRLIYTLSLASILFFFGCDQGSDVTSLLSESPDQQLKVESVHTSSEDAGDRNPYLHREKNLIEEEKYAPGADTIFTTMKLPPSEIPNLVVSKVIDGEDGGVIDFYYEYEIGEGEIITISAWMIIPSGTFNGAKEISIVFSHNMTMVTFSPHMDFDQTVEFEVEYTGLDLSGIDPNSVDFVFQKHDGSTEHINYDYITVNVSNGMIFLDDGELTHFSRYGFVN